MRRIRFAGVVRLANHVQREFGRPVSASRCDEERSLVARALDQVATTLRVHGASLRAVPGPTRRALEFLQNFDFSRVPVSETATSADPRESLVLDGLTALVERYAERIVLGPHDVHARIRESVAEIDARNERARRRPEHFTPRTREHLGWLRLMADRENFDDYRAAVCRATMIFESAARPERWPRPLALHFRPTRSIFRVRVIAGETRCLMPTPAIALDDAGFVALARAIFGRRQPGRSAALHALILGEAYQELQAELESLGGIVEDTHGLTHDLAASFDRVNASYFAGSIPRPRLTWNRSITAGKFGHYNYSCDTVMISRTLDRPEVPAFVVDHVMHHELLHKKHGIRWHAGRGHAHTPEFRAEERRFERFEEADAFLRHLARASG